jgi:4-hydroxy-2-oxoheptanedioate aldolase
MNLLEKRMVEQLKHLREHHHVVGVKAEFEAEGTRLEEALRLKEVITKAGLDLTIKIGGCEALKDFYDARAIGVTHIVAPMIESAYALKKYLASARIAYPPDERDSVKFLVNIETITACNSIEEILGKYDISGLAGIVLGRVDLTGSLGLVRENVNDDLIFDIATRVFAAARAKGLEVVVGGGVSKETIPFIKRFPEGTIARYETRKVIFGCPAALAERYDVGILKAVGFELMWLKNKRDFYGLIFKEDEIRIEMLERRYKKLIEEAGGSVE